ncbi:DUF2125 domain-containing protein [Thalassococcus lentus]|uniref:DUF2125 domain-containing protein n=1 Tax=Thalassococcus lentus TaxID=1210524 RepID=A0ABT4XMM2_9RHOB|nr:DUF2125 domain-containing protein [Thalassococcus lentus]MDA7423190.1 DUF2125 domain-containing protein [Thalassococcus lentus]
MKRLTFAIVAAALIWAGWWFFASQRLTTQTENWFEDRQAEGWQAQYGDLTLGGFPNRLDMTFTDLNLADPDSGLAWQAPFFQVFQIVYNNGHQIFAWPDAQQISTPTGQYDISSEGLRASLVRDGALIQRANLEAPVLNVKGPSRTIALAGLTAGLSEVPEASNTYRIALNANAVAGPSSAYVPTPDQIDGLKLQAEVSFDKALATSALETTRPQPTRIDLRLAEYSIEGLELKLAGVLDIDPRGQATGELTVRAVNWREMLALAGQSQSLPEGLISTLEQAFGLLSQLAGNGRTIDITVRFERGQMSVGLIPLGPAPSFRIP